MAKRTGKKATAEFYTTTDWRCEPRGSDCVLLAFAEARGKWETVALVKKTSGASAKALADYIAGVLNGLHSDRQLLKVAQDALEAILEEGLNYSTEQDADIVIRRLKNRTAAKGR
jgi:hypothetical protein